jgi:hypothetical protein
MKGVLLSVAVGGLAGLAIGEREAVPPPDPWLAETLRALVGDARTADVDRALFAVERHLLDAPDDLAALTLKHRLEYQQECRRDFDEGEHALANGSRAQAEASFMRVLEGCGLSPFARTRLQQLGGGGSGD